MLKKLRQGPGLILLGMSVCFAALCAFHLFTLNSFLLNSDEVAYTDYAYHGSVTLWRTIVPEKFGAMMYAFGTMQIYASMLKAVIGMFGIQVWSIRLLGCLSVLLGFLLFILLARKAIGEWSSIFLAIGGTQLFFWVTHSARPEGVVFLIGMVNFWWVLERRDLVGGLVSGILFALGAGIHQAIIFFIAPIVVLMITQYREGLLDKRSLGWWVVGAMVGAIWFLEHFEPKAFVTYSDVHYGGGKAYFLPFIEYKMNPIRIIDAGLQKINNPFAYRWENSLWAGIWTLFLCSLFYCWWERKRLSPPFKKLLLLTTTLFISYLLLNGSSTDLYQIYIFPWFFLPTYKFMSDLFFREDFSDGLVCGLGLLALYCLTQTMFASTSFFFIVVVLRVLSPYLLSRRYFLITALSLIAIGFLNWGNLRISYFFLKAMFLQKTVEFIALAVWPWILFKVENFSFSFRITKIFSAAKYVGLSLLAGLFFFFMAEVNGIRQKMDVQKTTQELNRIAPELFHKQRILGPGELWIYYPNLCVRDPGSMVGLANAGEGIEILKSFQAYNPEKAFWPKDHLRLLARENAKWNRYYFSYDAVVNFGTEDWTEVIFIKRPIRIAAE